MTEVKILKLSSGEEIICNVIDNESQSFININRPMKLNAIPKHARDGTLEESLSLQRCIHFSENNTYQIERVKVLVTTDASIGLSKFYSYCLNKLDLEDADYDDEPTLEELEELEDEFSDFEVTSDTVH